MYEFTSNIVKTDVTALKVFNDFLFCGIGGCVHIYNLSDSQFVSKQHIFEGIRIYGIQPSDKNILFYGENRIRTCSIDWKSLHIKNIHYHENNDWILTAKWLNVGENIVTISMHNVVEYFDDKMHRLREITCDEMCILYCAYISHDNWDEIIVFSGTVFSEILMWKPASGNQVLKRLKGHEGVLFSIYHKDEYVASTSDDRSVILWKINDLKSELVHRMYGHTARVFGCKLWSNVVLSVGEDGAICVWNFNGELVRRFDGHQGSPIWALESSEKHNVIITGGGDSGVIVFPIKPIIHRQKIGLDAKHVPKRVVLLENNDILVITESGCLFHYCRHEWVLIGEHEELKSYALLEISNCRKKIALAGYRGHIFIYELIEARMQLTLSYQTKTADRIFALHWLTCNIFLTCCSNGALFLWKHLEDRILLFHVMVLPPMKERWSTAACLFLGGVAVGDRKGNIHFYYLDDSNRVQTIKKAHNYLGITSLDYIDNTLISLGRNSVIRKYKLINGEWKSISSDKLQHSWLAKLSRNNSTTSLLAFSGMNLILFDYNKRRVLLSEPCGGGHRSWDFNNECFAYVKDKTINILQFEWDTIYPRDLIPGFNGSEINSLLSLREKDGLLLISGGEDTTLRISKYQNEQFKTVSILKSHLSSIRCLHLFKTAENRYYLFSAGGRAQIILWELMNGACNELFSYYEPIDEEESEIRVMDMTSVKCNDAILLLTACSDGKIKMYEVRNEKLFYKSELFYKVRCILKLTTITIQNKLILITMATDGLLFFWDLLKTSPFYSHQAHQSGINSYYTKSVNEDAFLMLTGGDDNAISLSLFQYSSNCKMQALATYKNSTAHWAQITGVHIADSLIFSTSLDQKFCVFEYCIDSDEIVVKFKGVYDTTISDIKGIEVWPVLEHKYEIILYGLGIEILTVAPK